MLCFFLDENTFCLYQRVSAQNNHRFSLSQDIPIVIKIKHPGHKRMFGMIMRDDEFLPPLIFLNRYGTDMRTHIKFLGDIMLPWIQKVTAVGLSVWQQDSALYHTSRKNWVLVVITFWGPLQFYYFTAKIHWVWSHSELCVRCRWPRDQQTTCDIKNELKARLTATFKKKLT